MRSGLAWRLLRHISVQEHASYPVRTALVVVALMLGVAMTVAMRLATDATVSGLRDDLQHLAGNAQLQVTFGTGEARLSESILDDVRAQPYVAAAAAVLRGSLAFGDESGDTIEVFGVDFLREDTRAVHEVEIVDRATDDLPVATDPYVILLSEVIAKEKNLGVGSKVALTGPKGTHEYRVHGILRMAGISRIYGGRTGVMYLPSAQLVFTDVPDPTVSLVHQIDVALVDGIGIEEARSRLRALLPTSLNVAEPIQRGIELQRNVSGLRATLLGISSLALLASMFIVYSANVAMIAYRQPTFAMLQKLGVPGRPIRALLLLEAGVLGAVAGALAVPLGFLFAHFALGDVAVGMELNYALRIAPSALGSGVHPMLSTYVVAGAVASLCAAFLPSRRVLLEDDPGRPRSNDDSENRFARRRLVTAGLWIILLGGIALCAGVATRTAWASALGGTVTIVGVVLSVLHAVDRAWKQVAKRALGTGSAVGWLSGENLVRDTERGLVAVAAIALCGAVAVAAATLPASFRSSAMSWYGFRGDVTITSRASGQGWLPAVLSPNHVMAITQLPAVERVETLRVLHGQPFRGESVAVVALSPGYAREVTELAATVHDPDTSDVSTGEAVLVSESFAKRYAVAGGDVVELGTPTGRVSLPIRGLIADFTSDRGSILISSALLRERWRDDMVHYASVDLSPGSDISMVARQLTEALGTEHGLVVYDTGVLRATIEAVLADAFRDVDAIQLLVFVITLAGIIDLVTSNVADRRREFGLLRAVGARDETIARSVAVEAGVLGATAGTIAVATGALFSYLWLELIYPVLVGYVLEHDFAWTAAVAVPLIACTTAIAAGYAAARVSLRSLPANAPRTH